jgi:hypothetical protein
VADDVVSGRKLAGAVEVMWSSRMAENDEER